MSVNVNKTITDPFKISELQSEVNASPNIIPSCMSVSSTDNNVTFEFAVALSGAEDIALDAVIATHVPSADIINAAQLPISPLDRVKLAVHSSPKPLLAGTKTVYSVWTGAGDDLIGDSLGGGELLHFKSSVGINAKTIEVEFLPTVDAGRVWIHEGSLKFEDAGVGDYMEATVRTRATPLQTATDLDLVLSGNKIKPAFGSPGTGTHGFDGLPVPIPRTFSKDGDWDIVNGTLVPNLSGTGTYALNQTERTAHQFVNKIPCYGTSGNYFTLSSDETLEIPQGFYIRIRQYNVSDTVWHASVIIEAFRERTSPQQ